MNLQMLRNTDGSGLVICVCGERSGKQIVIPLSQDLSNRIDLMLKQEGIMNTLLLPGMERSI